jgi:hypothetical protein
VNKPVDKISFTVYGVLLRSSQFIERAGAAAVDERKSAGAPRIIPGDWGKVESGWLTQPL